MTAASSTLTAPRGHLGWQIDDAVVQLREFGASRVYQLPDPPRACTIGTQGEMRLVDATGTVSRAHAEAELIEVDGDRVWALHDLQSKNGLRCDGKLCVRCVLRPGVEVSFGSVRFIAESEQLMNLLALLRRFLGWVLERQEYVDQVVRALRDWAAQRAELVVVGDGPLLPVVRRVHRLVIGESTPLLYEANGGDAAAVMRAIHAAMDGALCVQVKRREEARLVVERWLERRPGDRPRLIFCTADPLVGATILPTLGGLISLVHVPPLAARVGELEALVQAYVDEVVHELQLAEPGLTPHDMERLCALPFHSLAELEETVLRLVTLRTWGAPTGATRLGLDESSLRSWARRRGLAM